MHVHEPDTAVAGGFTHLHAAFVLSVQVSTSRELLLRLRAADEGIEGLQGR